MAKRKSAFLKIPASIVILQILSVIIPGDTFRTIVYRWLIYKPRKFLRTVLNSFYRIDHVYEVIEEFTKNYQGNFTILEFGVSAGNAFTKKLFAAKYLQVQNRIFFHGFDTFEGMPTSTDKRDSDMVSNDGWVEGQFKSSYKKLNDYCAAKYNNFSLHKGLFSDSLTDDLLLQLKKAPPILVWIDCDYYTSAKDAMERLIPILPNGCVIYFDEPEFNFGSRFTGESRLIHEINEGVYGKCIELVLDRELSLNTSRIYRFIDTSKEASLKPYNKTNSADTVRRIRNDSPLP